MKKLPKIKIETKSKKIILCSSILFKTIISSLLNKIIKKIDDVSKLSEEWSMSSIRNWFEISLERKLKTL